MGKVNNGLVRLFCCSALLGTSMLSMAGESMPSVEVQQTQENIDDAYSLQALKQINVNQLKINAQANQPEQIKDPLLSLNRKIFIFNEYLDKHIARPLAVQYVRVVPEKIRGGYTNFRGNLREPWSGVNQLLQLKPRMAAKSFARVVLNTLTSLGFADLAAKKKILSDKDDLGMTLGVWGVPSGAYVMLPFFGPKTIRDTFTYAIDSYGNPQRYMLDDTTQYLAYKAADAINTRTEFLDVDNIFQGDQYSIIRDTYLQQRSAAIAARRGEDMSETLFSEEPFADAEEPVPNTPTDELELNKSSVGKPITDKPLPNNRKANRPPTS